MTRRDFLAVAASGLAGAALGETAPAVRPIPASSDAGVVDTHTHFYDPTRPQGVPWPPQGDKLLFRTVLPKDYRALPTPQKVIGTVVVEASPWVGAGG